MYRELKKLIKPFFSKRVLFEYEPIFRKILYPFYKGVNFQCPICEKKLRKFIVLENKDKLCPNCGSISRTRRLWNILNDGYLKKGMHILDFSPSRSIYRILKKKSYVNYTSTDLSGDFLSDFQYDITDMKVQNDQYHLIICYHVLEHIDNDYQAMNELFRVLKKDGTCIIQTPFKEGEIYEDTSILNEHDRLIHFGQKDHVRIYSINGLKDRLTKCGFQVTVKQFSEEENNIFGYNLHENVLICTK